MELIFGQSRTYKNMAAAFAGECQDGARYQFASKIAKQQKLMALHDTIKMLAKEEMGHAERIFDMLTAYCEESKNSKCEMGTLEGICINASYPFKNGNLLEILNFNSSVEKHQKEVVYKEFSKTAKSEGYDEISIMFTQLAEVENCHSMLLDEIATQLKKGTMYNKPKSTTWKCSHCGHELDGKSAPLICPLCKQTQGTFYLKTAMYRYFME